MSKLQKIAQITQAVLDQVTGADLPTLYYHPHGEIRRVLDYLPQLKEKYRPTPWLSNTHAHLLYFDLIKKKTIRQQYEQVDQLTMQDGGITAVRPQPASGAT